MGDDKPREKTGRERTEETLRRAKSKIEESIERAQELQRREMFNKRLELARQGLRDYDNKRLSDAAIAFHSYIKILEEWKKVEEGGLMPIHFDPKKDVAELVLLSGVFWDLAKLYDRTKGEKKQKEFKLYLDKFVVFAKGTPLEAVCAETLRKYVSNDKPLHKKEFAEAYKKLTDGKDCFVVSVLGDRISSRELDGLRYFRDMRLMNSRVGRSFVRNYYRFGPKLARVVDHFPSRLKDQLSHLIRFVARCVQI